MNIFSEFPWGAQDRRNKRIPSVCSSFDKKYDTWKYDIEIKIKLRARIICSGRWTDVCMYLRYTGTACTRVYEIPDERSPWTFPHTRTLARLYTYATAKGPAHTRKGNEAWFQLSGITLLAGCHYLSGYHHCCKKARVQSSETKERVGSSSRAQRDSRFYHQWWERYHVVCVISYKI